MPAADPVDHRRALGTRGEEIAATHLRTAGMLILDRNWRPHGSEAVGEVDLIARDGDALVIVEVKTRRSLAFGAPVEAVTRRKIRQLRSLALAWLDERSIHAPALRFDLVAVTIPPAGQPVVEHLRAV
jgi:putative endonuclease